MNKQFTIVMCAAALCSYGGELCTFNGSVDTAWSNAGNWNKYPSAGDTVKIADGKTAIVNGADSAQTELLASLLGAEIGSESVLRVLNYPDGKTFALAAGKLALTGTGSFEFVCNSSEDTVAHGTLSIASDNLSFAGSFVFDNVSVQIRSLNALGSGCPIDFNVPAKTLTNRQPFGYFTSGVYNHPLTVKNTRSYFAVRADGCAVTNNGAFTVAADCTFPVRINAQNNGCYFAQAGDITVNSSSLLLHGNVGLTGAAKMKFSGTSFVTASGESDQIDLGKREIVATVSGKDKRPVRINRGHWKLMEDDVLTDVPFSFGGDNATYAVWLDLNGHSTYLGYKSLGWLEERQQRIFKGLKHIVSSAGPATATIAVGVNGYDGVSESTYNFGRFADIALEGYVTVRASFPATGIADGTWYTGFLCPDGVVSSSAGALQAAMGTIRMTAKSRYVNLGKLEVTGNNGNFWVQGTPTLGSHTALVMSRSSTDTSRANGYVRIDADQTMTVATASDAGTPIAAGEYTKDTLPNVLAPAGTGKLIVTGTPTITAADVTDETALVDGTGFLSSTVLTMSAEELAKVPREIDGELASYRIAENVATMPHLSPALASTAGWKVELVEGSLYLNAKTLGMTLIFW